MEKMKAIPLVRFNALAGYSRDPSMPLMAREIAWYQEGHEKVLGLVVLDRCDQDYACYVLGRDAKARFRCVWLEVSIPTEAKATALLGEKLAQFAQAPPETFYQGDEMGKPIDFFTPVVRSGPHPIFEKLVSNQGWTPARALLGEMMHYFKDPDGNFVQQFQTAGFNQRLWELYLFALLTELGYGLDRSHAVPDFHARGLRGEFFMEATTINPPNDGTAAPAMSDPEYFAAYVPIRFAGALSSKLQKEYWKQPHVAGHPLILAIQDFHADHSMAWSNSALVEYLYAIRQVERIGKDGSPEITSQPVKEYRWAEKAPISAGFFDQPGSEHVSAVLANPSATLSKFNRIGFLAGFGDRDIKMFRKGLCYRGKLVPEQFADAVHEAGYSEDWCQGLNVYHNPRACISLPDDAFPGAAHHSSRSGRIVSNQPSFQPIGSVTAVLVPS